MVLGTTLILGYLFIKYVIPCSIVLAIIMFIIVSKNERKKKAEIDKLTKIEPPLITTTKTVSHKATLQPVTDLYTIDVLCVEQNINPNYGDSANYLYNECYLDDREINYIYKIDSSFVATHIKDGKTYFIYNDKVVGYVSFKLEEYSSLRLHIAGGLGKMLIVGDDRAWFDKEQKYPIKIWVTYKTIEYR